MIPIETIAPPVDQDNKTADSPSVGATPDIREDARGDHRIGQPHSKKTCILCGLELSGGRALECFQKETEFMCEDCETWGKSEEELGQ